MIIYHLIVNQEVAYVGKTNNSQRRARQHRWLLKNNKHQNKYLQSQYNKYKSFDMVIAQENATDRDEQTHIMQNNTQQRNVQIEPTIDELRDIHRRIFG